MFDDTRSTVSGVYPRSLSEEVVEIAKYRTGRREALKWATKLRFLAYDDTADGHESPRNQQCTRCAKLGDIREAKEAGKIIDIDHLHVCKDPFFNNHHFTAKEQQTSPLRFQCDGCRRPIFIGNRYCCVLCAEAHGASGSYDLCESCVGVGKHCPDLSHSLEKFPTFEFGDCIHVNARTCKDCQHVPLFPTDRSARTFKIVRLGDHESRASGNSQARSSLCDDFIAVSYCWPSAKLDDAGKPFPHSGQYSVKDENGSIRQNRAPEEVLDRAVAFASQNGLRLLWIDQECIDQDDPGDKGLGIQAMDKVYQRAFLSIGLLQTSITSNETLDALNYLFTKDGNVNSEYLTLSATATTGSIEDSLPPRIGKIALASKIVAFLETLAGDTWHTRAWILQETFSAGPRMCLLLRRTPNITTRGLPGVSQTLSITEVVIRMDALLGIIDHAKHFLLRLPLSIDTPVEFLERRRAVLQKLEEFPPGEERAMEARWNHPMGTTRPRRSCNAAVAVSYLRLRDNSVISDRLAIIANLCNYEYRLNTLEVEKHHESLGACILTLALINEDFSILYPEVCRIYQCEYDGKSFPVFITVQQLTSLALESYRARDKIFSWMSMTPELFKDIHARSLDSFAHYELPTNIEYPITPNGLTLHGYLWKIDRKIPMSELHAIMTPSNWYRMRFVILSNHRLIKSGFSSATVKALKKSNHYSNLDDSMRSKYELYFTRILANDPKSLDEVEKQRQHFMKKSLDADIEAINDTKSLLLNILYILKAKGEIAVADAIWDSVRGDKWEMRETLVGRGCYNTVADFPAMANSAFHDNSIELDFDEYEGFRQWWIIDRIMQHGCIWSGKVVRISHDENFHLHPAWFLPVDPEKVGAEEDNTDGSVTEGEGADELRGSTDQKGLVSAQEVLLDPAAISQATDLYPTAPTEKIEDWKERVDLQLFKQLMQSGFINSIKDIEHHMGDVKGNIMEYDGPELSLDKRKQISGAAFWYFGTKNQWNNVADEEKVQGLRCVFDVDGPNGMEQNMNLPPSTEDLQATTDPCEKTSESVFVLTPYNARHERLPHSEARTMSMSWVVQPREKGIEDGAGADGIREAFCTNGMVKGMWKFLDEPAMRYMLV